ncbi:MAG: DUF4296 domain-containing protein [Bacteroidetes bacterium]|nr:DUF4296 domain-containing protein [Bacteroidota bacterium]
MNKFSIALLLCLSLLACGKKKPSIPDDVLNKTEMTAILSDMHIAQASMATVATTDSSMYSMKQYTEYILKNHNTTQEKYARSLKFYSDNPGLLQEVYDSVITNLSRIQGEAEGLQ